MKKLFLAISALVLCLACKPELGPADPAELTPEEAAAVEDARNLIRNLKSIEYVRETDEFAIPVYIENKSGRDEALDVSASFRVLPEGLGKEVASLSSHGLLKFRLVYKNAGKLVRESDCTPSSVAGSFSSFKVEIPASELDPEFVAKKLDCYLTVEITDSRNSITSRPVGMYLLKGRSINGTRIASGMTLFGQVRDSSTGKGIPEVAVTDGYTYVLTDVNGVYQMKPDKRCRKVYLSFPAGYEIPMDSRKMPQIYSDGWVDVRGDFRCDFSLTPLDHPEEDFTLMMISDPQCSKTSQSDRYKNETIKDMQAYLNEQQAKGRWKYCYAFTLGDITSDSTNMWPYMMESMSNVSLNSGYLPFFQCIGNHDHNSLVEGTGEEGDYNATLEFFKNCGPTDYSVNRGKAHILVMDDILCSKTTANTSVNKATWSYSGGFTDTQLEWLRQDLAAVKDKEDKVVFLCLHIQIRSDRTNNRAQVLSLLSQFKEAHVMIGHTHYPQNWIHNDYVCKGGKPVYEHIHGAACGAWWSCNSNTSGEPNCYNLYEIKGNNVRDWVAKPTLKSETYQLRVYDGNQVYTGAKQYQYSWFNTSNLGGSANIDARGNVNLKGCFVAEVWNDDPQNWTVELWQGGKKVGNFTRFADGTCANIAMSSYYFNELNKNSTHYASRTASHIWYYKPSSQTPATEKNWEVRATQKIMTSGVTHTFTCSKLTTDYSEF